MSRLTRLVVAGGCMAIGAGIALYAASNTTSGNVAGPTRQALGNLAAGEVVANGYCADDHVGGVAVRVTYVTPGVEGTVLIGGDDFGPVNGRDVSVSSEPYPPGPVPITVRWSTGAVDQATVYVPDCGDRNGIIEPADGDGD